MDPVSAIGLAAAILQFIDVANKVVARLSDFGDAIEQAPRAFRQIHTELPLIIDCLRRIKVQDNEGILDTLTRNALGPVVQECYKETERLRDLLADILPSAQASSWERRVKAVKSLGSDKKVENIADALAKYVKTLTFHQVLANSATARAPSQPQPVAPWKPFWLVPYDRNLSFVGRDDIFDEIEKTFSVPQDSQPKAALCGLGGIGKTQIALEYCYRKRETDSQCSIFWVNAATVARFEESIKRVAVECGAVAIEDASADAASLLKNYLELRHGKPWIMVVDNIDDEASFFRESMTNKKTPSQCIPRCRNGFLLFTTRVSDVAVDLGSPANPIVINAMNQNDSLELVKKRLHANHSDDVIFELLKELDYIPLAVTQAVSFMVKRRNTVPQYLSLYRGSDAVRTKLLTHEFSDHARYERSIESVAKTWAISFDSIRKTSPRAADLLCLMCFFQPQGITKRLLKTDAEDDFDFDEAMGLLQAFSLVAADDTNTRFRTHRLVQLATKWWIKADSPAEVDRWALQALKSLSANMPRPNETLNVMAKFDLLRSDSFLPHIESVLGHAFGVLEREVELERATVLAFAGAYIIFIRGEIVTLGIARVEEALRIRRKHLGMRHILTLEFESLKLWQMLLETSREESEVITQGQQIAELHRETLGEDHPNTIESLYHLAVIMRWRRVYESSEPIIRDAVARSERVLGPDHEKTLIYKEELALILFLQGKDEDGVALQRNVCLRALALNEPDNIEVLQLEFTLAFMLAKTQWTRKEAIAIYQRVVEGYRIKQGAGFWKTLHTVFELVKALEAEEEWIAAKVVCEDTLRLVPEGKYIDDIREHLDAINIRVDNRNVA